MAEELRPDICVVGGGPAGIAVAVAAANSDVPVVLVERGRLGGSAITRGAIPARAFAHAARSHAMLRQASARCAGDAPPPEADFARVAAHVAAARETASASLAPERLAALGVRVVAGEGRFTDRRTILAGETTIRARRFVLATGSVPNIPAIPGLGNVDYLTADTAFGLDHKPRHLVVLGTGDEGLSLAQSFLRLGVPTTLVMEAPPLEGADPELAALAFARLRAEGLRIVDGVKLAGIARHRGGVRLSLADRPEGEGTVDGSHLLLALGRMPGPDSLGLAEAGIVADERGIVVDRKLRTTNRRVYAIGDATAGPASIARGQYEAGMVLRAILWRSPRRAHAAAFVPAVAWSDPGLASVGWSEAEARRRVPKARVFRYPFAGTGAAAAEANPEGMVKVVTNRQGRILGAAVAGDNAAELIAFWSLALAKRMKLQALAGVSLPGLARAEALKGAIEAWAGPGLAPRWQRRIVAFLRKFG